MLKRRFLAYVLLGSNVAMALPFHPHCPNVLLLQKGQINPDCERVALSLAYDERIRKDLIDVDYNKKIMENQKRLLELNRDEMELQIKRVALYETYAEKERSIAERAKQSADINLWVGLGMGVLTTVMILFSVRQ